MYRTTLVRRRIARALLGVLIVVPSMCLIAPAMGLAPAAATAVLHDSQSTFNTPYVSPMVGPALKVAGVIGFGSDLQNSAGAPSQFTSSAAKPAFVPVSDDPNPNPNPNPDPDSTQVSGAESQAPVKANQPVAEASAVVNRPVDNSQVNTPNAGVAQTLTYQWGAQEFTLLVLFVLVMAGAGVLMVFHAKKNGQFVSASIDPFKR